MITKQTLSFRKDFLFLLEEYLCTLFRMDNNVSFSIKVGTIIGFDIYENRLFYDGFIKKQIKMISDKFHKFNY